MSVLEEKRTWVEPYTRADGTEVQGYWRNVDKVAEDVLPDWPIMPEYVYPQSLANALLKSHGKEMPPGTYKAEQVFTPLLHDSDRDTAYKLWAAFKDIDRKHSFESSVDHPINAIPVLHLPANDPVDGNLAASAMFYSDDYIPETPESAAKYLPTMITISDLPPEMTAGGDVDSARFAVVHEIGHYVDQQLVGTQAFASTRGAFDQEGPLTGVMQAIWDSTPFEMLRSMAGDETEFPTNRGPMKLNQDFIQYLMQPYEAFARAYSQWVLEDSDDPDTPKLLYALSNDSRNLYPQQWTRDEFTQIREELEKVFGGRKKDIRPDVPFEEDAHPRDMSGRFRDKIDPISEISKIPKETLHTARWPMSLSDGDWKEKVAAVQGKLPTPKSVQADRAVDGLPDDLAELVREKMSGRMSPPKWNTEMTRRLDELPVGTKLYVYPNPTEHYSVGSTNGRFVKQEDGRWIKPGVSESDSKNAIISNINVARAIAEQHGTYTGKENPHAEPIRQTDFYEDLDKVMEAGNAIHAEVGRRLREKGFYDIVVKSDEEMATERLLAEEDMVSARRSAHEFFVDKILEQMRVKYNTPIPRSAIQELPENAWSFSSPDLNYGSLDDEEWNTQEVTRRFYIARGDVLRSPEAKAKMKEAQDAYQQWANLRYDPKLTGESGKFEIRRETIREVLSEIRPMGGGKYEFAKYTRKNPIAVAQQAAKWLPDAWVKASNDKYSIPGYGKLTVKFLKKGRGFYRDGEDLAAASPWRSRVKGDNGYFSVMAHELVHRAEFTLPQIKLMEWVYYHKRTKNDPPQKLQKLYPGARYRKDEETRPDEFIDAYAGKDYGNTMHSTYEIMTTGVQDMLTGVMGIGSLDPDQTKFVLGMLAAA